MFGLPGAIARPLGRRMEALNQAVDRIATEHRTIPVDPGGTHGNRWLPRRSTDLFLVLARMTLAEMTTPQVRNLR
jgi:hypothetical protein